MSTLRYAAIAAAVVLAASPVLSPNARAADVTPGWTDCSVGYSEHMSSLSDLGGDIKTGQAACARVTDSGVRQTFEVGAIADTPPAGRRNIVMSGGVPQTVSGYPSNQLDTFETYAGFGEEWDRSASSALAFNIEAGEINGLSTDMVRGFLDDMHRWEGKGYSRHSPLSASGRPLIQVSGLHTSAVVEATEGPVTARLSDVESVTAGSSIDALTLGVQGSLTVGSKRAVLPSDLPGMGQRPASGSGLYAGVYSQSTAYGLPTESAGTEHEYLYTQLGGSVQIGRHLTLGAAFTHSLTSQVHQEIIQPYNYLGLNLGYVF
jgi:hypothetical protein